GSLSVARLSHHSVALAAAHLPAPQLAAFLTNAVRRNRLPRRPRHLRTAGLSIAVGRAVRYVGPIIGRRRVTAGAVGNGEKGSEACHHDQTPHVTHSLALGPLPRRTRSAALTTMPHPGPPSQAETANLAFAKSAVLSTT